MYPILVMMSPNVHLCRSTSVELTCRANLNNLIISHVGGTYNFPLSPQTIGDLSECCQVLVAVSDWCAC